MPITDMANLRSKSIQAMGPDGCAALILQDAGCGFSRISCYATPVGCLNMGMSVLGGGRKRVHLAIDGIDVRQSVPPIQGLTPLELHRYLLDSFLGRLLWFRPCQDERIQTAAQNLGRYQAGMLAPSRTNF